MRSACKLPLLKSVNLSSGKHVFYPYLTYCYLGVKVALQQSLKCTEFLQMCTEWRRKNSSSDTYSDIYDGNVWKEFQTYKGIDFLYSENNLALMMNFDFFQPYKHVQYSVGAIYFTVLNLPRSVRYKRENVILAGIIPGPKEPERNINTYLEPLVNELKQFWNGVDLISNGVHKTIRCALICVACDLPAGRKACGFLSYNAKYGCTRCKKEFTGTVGYFNFSGFDRGSWPARDGEEHKRTALSLKNPTTQTEMINKESSNGCRYSILLELEYFDGPRFLIVDPMHNLYLGTAKHYLRRVFIEKGIISDEMFGRIQEQVNTITVPSGIGRIPHKIRSGFSSFTANQWQNWVNYYSLLVLSDILSEEHLECWRHFVLASRILCCKELTQQKIKLADSLLLRFCQRSERVYGSNIVTPNMHMHCHLASCGFDYGPLHGFWLYAFERYNGILGSFPNNNRSIEVQLMERYLNDQSVRSLQLPNELSGDFGKHFSMDTPVGSVADTINPYDLVESTRGVALLPSRKKRYLLDQIYHDFLSELFCKLYKLSSSSLVCPSFCWKYNTVEMYGKQLGCHMSQSAASSIVLASWNSELFGLPLVSLPPGYTLDNNPLRAAKINSFLSHTFTANGKQSSQMLVCLSWYKYHPNHYSRGKPLLVWSTDLEAPGLYSCVPISFVKHRTVSLMSTLPTTGESVLIVCPCIDF